MGDKIELSAGKENQLVKLLSALIEWREKKSNENLHDDYWSMRTRRGQDVLLEISSVFTSTICFVYVRKINQ